MTHRPTPISSSLLKYSKLLAATMLASLDNQMTKLKPKSRKPHAQTSRLPKPRAPSAFKMEAWWSILKDAGSEWVKHRASTSGAALAYYSLFSVGPLIVIVIAVAGLVFGDDAVRGQVSDQLSNLVGEQGAKGIESLLAAAGRPAEGVLRDHCQHGNFDIRCHWGRGAA